MIAGISGLISQGAFAGSGKLIAPFARTPLDKAGDPLKALDLAQCPSNRDHAFYERGRRWWRTPMKQMSLRTFAIATSALACATLLSFSWSEQRGVSLAVESAQARIGRPLTPMSFAGVARRQYRRGAYGYGAGVVGAGLAAGAIGAAAVAATSPYGYYGGGPYYGGYGTDGYYGTYGGYPGGYYGGYANRSYVTGRPTLFP